MENPITPVYSGGCQGPSLGIPIAAFEQVDEGVTQIKGTEVPNGEPGEIVATAAFPSMPVKFWGDEEGKKYFNAYFARFDSKFSIPFWGLSLFVTRANLRIFKMSGHTATLLPSIHRQNRCFSWVGLTAS
jgi:acyl-coenzyme A synthetase/AMP-(fatty) acid ligase